MCDDVAEGLVVDVTSWVNGSQSEGLIHLRIREVTMIIHRITVNVSLCGDTNLLC